MTKSYHRHTGQFFSRGVSHFCLKKYFNRALKTAMLTCKITFPNSPHPIIISKKFRFRALHLARRNDFVWLLAYAWKFSIYPKNNGFARRGSCSPPSPRGSYVYEVTNTKSRPSAVNETPPQIRDVTCHTWNYIVLAATRHKWTHPNLTPARGLCLIWLPWTGRMEGWVDLIMCKTEACVNMLALISWVS